jgi:hypothetical protein
VTTQRFIMVVLWALAIVLPGGLPLLALYLSVKAARAKALAATAQPVSGGRMSFAPAAASGRLSIIPG